MEKDLEEYQVIPKIKKRMKEKEGVTADQVKGYNRRVLGSPVFQVHVEMLEEFDNKKIRAQKMLLEKNEEIKHLEVCLKIQAQKANDAEQFIIDCFGTKSYEWQKYKSFN